jgi:hypothetical protein
MPKGDKGAFPQERELTDAEVFGDPRDWGAEPIEDPRSWGAEPVEAPRQLDVEAVDTDSFGPPRAWLDRIRQGQALQRILDRVKESAGEGFGPQPLGLSDEHQRQLRDLGIFTNLSTGKPGVIGLLEAPFEFTSQTLDAIMRSANAGVHGLGGAFGQLIEELEGNRTEGLKAEREAINFWNQLQIEMGMGSYVRMIRSGPHDMAVQPIGGLPNKWDFKNAADALGGKGTEARLRQLWQEKGVHPAEAVHDAQQDAFLHAELTAGGADVTRPENLPTLQQQPPPAPGLLIQRLRGLGDSLTGLGRSLLETTNPMLTGSRRSMVVAKDYADTVRRIDWEWLRYDHDLATRFTPEQRTRMFVAMDEESVMRQLGETNENMGLATLTDEERAAVEDLDARQQEAWLAARDLEMVQGDGLPMHATRYVLNLANADGRDPLALDTIGRNLSTRTGQMQRRKHLMIEETEEAARALVAESMQKAGRTPEEIARAVEKVKVATDIRAVALSTAKLEKAIAGRTLVDDIKDIGEASGDTLVHEGEAPGFFTLSHPALRTWRPKFSTAEDGSVSVLKDADGNIVFEPAQLHIADEFKGPLQAILGSPVEQNKVYQAYLALKGKAMGYLMNSPLIHFMVVWGKVAPSAPGQWAGAKLYFTGNRIVNDPVRSSQLVQRGLAPIGRNGSFQDISSIMEEPTLQPGHSFEAQVLGLVPDLFNPKAGDAVRAAIDKAGDFWHNTLLWDRVRDVQFGLADHMSRNLQQAGLDAVAADRIGSYFSNAIVGSIPKEAMSVGARMTANIMLFSRSFTLGNWQVIKTALTGLPAPIRAQLERDLGMTLGEAGAEAAVKKLGRGPLLGTAARMALGIIAVDYVFKTVVNSLLQNAANVAVNDSTWNDEFHGYARRLREEMQRTTTTPWELFNPLNFNENIFGLPGRLASTSENEPGKQNRIHIGYDKDRTALYARNPMGKYPEEVTDWFTGPLDVMRRKFSPMAGGALDVLFNTAGPGRRIYDETAETTIGQVKNILDVAEHIIGKHLPEMQLRGFGDLLSGNGEARVKFLQTFAPLIGFTVSQGYPGGPARGELMAEQRAFNARFDLAWPEIRRQIRNGNIDNATAAMDELGMTPPLKRAMLRRALDPAYISGRTMRDFLYRATPEQKERFERARH